MTRAHSKLFYTINWIVLLAIATLMSGVVWFIWPTFEAEMICIVAFLVVSFVQFKYDWLG